jgi:tryptophan synthase alpha chain
MNRIEQKFKELKQKNKKAFCVFITCGDPDLETTKKLLLEFDKIGVDLIELGLPFSDPLADGPVIQRASERALKKGINADSAFGLVKELRDKIGVPICLLTYYNLIFCYPEKLFLKEAKKSGIDGLIIPDLPPEEAKDLIRQAGQLNLDIIFFLSPTSNLERIKLVSKVSEGFIYYVSLTGVTGEREKLSGDLMRNILLIKKFTEKPILVGFGISKPEQVKKVLKIADGVIVGSAIIRRIEENIDRGDLIERVINFVKGLIVRDV